MKKQVKKYPAEDQVPPKLVAEFETVYQIPDKTPKKAVGVKDFKYADFKKILDKGPFSLAEWADLLYVSERTLQRYSKENTVFNGLHVERILLLENLIDEGILLFGKDNLKSWLQSKPFSLHGDTVKEHLSTHAGIQSVIDLIHRIQQGIPA